MAATDVNARWQAQMAELLRGPRHGAPGHQVPAAQGGLPPRGPAPRPTPPTTTQPRSEQHDDFTDTARAASRSWPSRCRPGPSATPGTRFKVFGTPGHPAHGRGEARRRREGAPAHRARADGRPAHPVGPGRRLRRAAGRTPRTSASRSAPINSNTFQDDDYKFGSLTHVDPSGPAQGDRPPPRVHRRHGRRPGSRDLKIWLADGTNYPGQGDMRGRQDRLADASQQIYARLGDGPAAGAGVQVLRAGVLPHRRPGLGHVVRPRAWRSGERAVVCLDTGHHAPGTNIEFIVAQLLRLGQAGLVRLQLPLLRRRRPDRRGGRPVPAVPDPVRGDPRRRLRRQDSDVAFMLDQCHNVEEKIPGQIRSVLNVQEMTARALLVDREALAEAAARRRRPGRQRHLHGRVLHRRARRPRRLAESPRPARRPDAALRRERLPGADRRRPRRRRTRPDGAPDMPDAELTHTDEQDSR